MQRILAIFLLTCTAGIAVAQSHSFDTTIRYKGQAMHISIRDIKGEFVLLAATLASHKALTDTVSAGGLCDIEFPDFNRDGHADIMLTYMGNNPMYALYLFDPASRKFKEISDFGEYPESIRLKTKPGYYYSYHRAGCADLEWVSDLFKIVNFKIVHLGHIDGHGCMFEVEKNPQTIEVYKILGGNNDKRKLIAKLPYLKHVPDFGDKWDFIEKYWNEQYRKFG